MKHFGDVMKSSPEMKRQHLANFSWCALIALNIAKQDGVPEEDSHQFLVAWLKKAYSDSELHAEVKDDIRWFLQQAEVHGKGANLIRKFSYLWHMASGQVIDNADMLNLTKAINFAQSLSWRYQLSEEHTLNVVEPTSQNLANTIRISRQSLEKAFNTYGKQIHPVKAIIEGNISSMKAIMKEFSWEIQDSVPNNIFLPSGDHVFLLQAVGMNASQVATFNPQ